jgi:hypothetical protein
LIQKRRRTLSRSCAKRSAGSNPTLKSDAIDGLPVFRGRSPRHPQTKLGMRHDCRKASFGA